MADECILVVDDEPQVLMLMNRFLQHMEYRVETADGGMAALEQVRHRLQSEEGAYALMVCDLKMPGVDGLSVLQQVKELSPDTMFILVTGFATLDSAVTALRQGAYDYLTKPLDLDHLLLTVQRALDHRKLVLDNQRLMAFLKEQNALLESLHREEQHKSEQLRQVNAIARQITAILDVDVLAKTVVDLIGPAFGFPDPSFGLIERETLCFTGGPLAGQRMPAAENVFWTVTDGGRTPFVRAEVGANGGSSPGPVPYDLVFPLQAGQETVGFWVANWETDAEYREENLPYLESLAAQTVAVLENARLYALARQADELAFLNMIAQAANQSLDLEDTIRSVLIRVHTAFQASLAEICLFDDQKRVAEVYSLFDGALQQGPQPLLGSAFVRRVGEGPLIEQGTIQVDSPAVPAGGGTDAAAMPSAQLQVVERLRSASHKGVLLVDPVASQQPPVEARDARPEQGQAPLALHSLLGVPLRFGEQQMGVLGVARAGPGAYDAESGRLLQVAGGQVASAIENARLFQEVVSGRRAILESRNTLQALFDGILEGIYIVDLEGEVRAVNRTQAAWAGKEVADLIGQPACDAFPASQCAPELVRETFQTGKPAARTERWQKANGQWTEWEIHTYPIARTDVPSTPERVIVVVRDVTEQRWLEMSLLQSEKLAAVGTLAAGIAHEINNPMTVISANAQILREEISSAHPYRGSVEMIDRAAERASKIVRNLLDLSRPEEFEFMPTDANLSLHEAISLVEPQLRGAHVRLIRELEPDLPPIWASPDHLQVVWLNLLLNALDAIQETEREGEIRVTSHRQGDWILVHVADNGVGIPDSQIAHIYDPFFTTKEPGKGTGLGLFTCYRTVTRHGGEISVDSQVGGGTAFHVSLPIRRELVPGAQVTQGGSRRV